MAGKVWSKHQIGWIFILKEMLIEGYNQGLIEAIKDLQDRIDRLSIYGNCTVITMKE